MKTFYRSILVWLFFVAIAFVNGAFREFVLIPILEIAPHRANQISCLTGVALWLMFFSLIWKKLEVRKMSTALLICGGWVVATMLFETFIIDRKLTWPQIINTYDVSAGEYWGLVLLWIGLMPPVAYAIGRARTNSRI